MISIAAFFLIFRNPANNTKNTTGITRETLGTCKQEIQSTTDDTVVQKEDFNSSHCVDNLVFEEKASDEEDDTVVHKDVYKTSHCVDNLVSQRKADRSCEYPKTDIVSILLEYCLQLIIGIIAKCNILKRNIKIKLRKHNKKKDYKLRINNIKRDSS